MNATSIPRVLIGFLWVAAACIGVRGQGAIPIGDSAQTQWGRLANPSVEGDRIKATLFFAGQARDGTSPYGCPISDQRNFYTVNPQDGRHLTWAAGPAQRQFALDQMLQAGINVVEMSFWGEDFLPCSSGWAKYAPMQDSAQAQDELITAAVGQPLLIIPFIESRGDWKVRDEFPRWTDGRVAPGLVSQLRYLIQRYLQNPLHPEWAAKWAQVYDRLGQPRHAVVIIQAASDQLNVNDHQAFASGFDLVADTVEQATGVQVGFLLDALPPGSHAKGVFKPSPELTGPFLANTASVLGINCFIPEIFAVPYDNPSLLVWKRDFISRWLKSGLPVLMDVSPGYDAHLVFGDKAAHAYGYTTEWRDSLAAMTADYGWAGPSETPVWTFNPVPTLGVAIMSVG